MKTGAACTNDISVMKDGWCADWKATLRICERVDQRFCDRLSTRSEE